MEKKFGKDLTVGSIPRHLLAFSIPMLIGNIIQVGYNIVNTIWVGNLIGKDAVGAIGVTFPILIIMIGISMGITMGTTILISQYYGAKNFNMVKNAVNNSFSLALIILVTLITAGIFFADSILKQMNTPSEIFKMASGFLKIRMLSFVPLYIVILTSSILRGIGDTVTPLIFMSIGVGINAVLDPLLIGGFWSLPYNGINGAAYATLIAQIVSMIVSIIYLNRKDHVVAFNYKKLQFDKSMSLKIIKLGFPISIQQTLISLGMIFVITFVNAFGSDATNAFGAVGRVDMIAFFPAMSLSIAVSTLTGQNLGAQKKERVKEIFKWGMIMTAAITITISLIAVLLPKQIFMMFGIADDARVLEIGTQYLHIVGSAYVLFAVMFIANGVANGAGHTMITLVITLLGLWAIRIPLAWALSKTDLGLTGIWLAIVISFLVNAIISLGYHFSGRWEKTAIAHAPYEPPIMD